MKGCGCIALLILTLCQGIFLNSLGQQSTLMNYAVIHPLILNPALAGTRNSVAIDLYTRQQWLGIEDAPSFYSAAMDFPINESMASLGFGGWSEQTGPLMYNRLFIDYAYLVRVSRRAFLSLGIRAGADHFNLNLNQLQIIDYNDPEFSGAIQNEFRPSWGTGIWFYTPTVFLGVSLPHRPLSNISWASEAARGFESAHETDLLGGLHFNVAKKTKITISALHRFVQNDIATTDLGFLVQHSQGLKYGLIYRPNIAVAALFGLNITDEIGFFYSYETSLDRSQPIVKNGSHELSILFNFTGWIKYNRDRLFKRKKVEKEELNSIRYF
ncbi:PorP/SprF family type IX secretion system membrane protein [Thermophagus xiamenensis]|uniref:Type IX secretion system membrane protein, PorP/SprF family n=1 Tax=Thermophagus xiamenensis TaxID=385682 RepID=A0A1I1WZB3_9BACT|nr:PorP/SprF family type IX secretion system membrane protein [Thermophagus xiamenensis]SFE00447.1 type IX secretion system membrane protein, PorP/SprF family [Thermophagus xiamenensis]